MIAAIAIVIFAFSAAAYWKYHKRPALRFPQQSTSATGSAVPGGETAAEAPAEQVEDLKSGEGAAGTGELSIDSKPQGALIALDGRHDVVWIAPYTFSNLKPGTHKITLQMDGYRTENRSLVIAAGKRVNDTFEMILNKGYLEVSTDPAGAALLLDGEATGQVTPGKLTLDPGPHRVAIRLDGYKAESAMVDVSAGQTLSISPKLTRSGPQGAQVPPAGPGKVTGDEPFDTPEQPGMNPLGRVRRFFAGVPAGKGVIEIRSRPRGADVWINRFQVPARTPLRIPIKPGTYVVTVHLPGFKPYSKTVEVKQGDVVPVETQLDKQP